MRKFTLLTSVLLTAPFVAGNVSAQCVATQDCATLGYTETSCENGGIKCPFGNTWACKASSGTGRDNPDCTYGAIYYSDGTCVKEFIPEKTAIGFVVYDENNEKWIMALHIADRSVKWSTEDVDIPEITNYITEQTVVQDLKSCENTKAMLALGEEKYPAAAVAKNYAPAGAENTKGKWCLPAMGIWNMINVYYKDINKTNELLNGTDFSGYYYWSSSEYASIFVWQWKVVTGFIVTRKDSYYDVTGIYGGTVRPVLKI